MEVNIGVVRGSTLEEVQSKKYNIYIGISLGNKWFTKENIEQNILWSLKYTKEKVAILIADTLHAINYEVRNKWPQEKAIKKAVQYGEKIEEEVKGIISKLPTSDQQRIVILKWEDVKKDTFNKISIPYFFDQFKKNIKFRNEVEKIVHDYTKKEKRTFTAEDIEKLCGYILFELPELLHGFTYKGIYYNCYTYPYDSPLTRFVDKIQRKKLFPEFHDEIRIQNNVFVELKII